jgi:methylenetetrahydrofolate--tRNA-(uracil-5-)-methyltransferase
MSFFDAASPIVVGESIDQSVAFMASRYDRGEAAYLNCPMNREQYLHFWTELCQAEQAELKDFERETAKFFEACLPIEEMARRGEDTMRYGPLKPVGLFDARLGTSKIRPIRTRNPTPWCSCGRKTRAASCGTWWAFKPTCAGANRRGCFG